MYFLLIILVVGASFTLGMNFFKHFNRDKLDGFTKLQNTNNVLCSEIRELQQKNRDIENKYYDKVAEFDTQVSLLNKTIKDFTELEKLNKTLSLRISELESLSFKIEDELYDKKPSLIEKSNNITTNIISESTNGKYDFIAIDFETANKKPYSICSIGITGVKDNLISFSDSFLIKPPSKSFSFTYLHGISYEDVKYELPFDEFWYDHLSNLFKGETLAAHYANFDMNALVETLKYYDIEVPSFNVIDSCLVAKKAYPNLPNHKLNTVADFLNINLDHHNAQSDAMTCAQIIIENKNNATVYDLETIINKSSYNKIFFDN